MISAIHFKNGTVIGLPSMGMYVVADSRNDALDIMAFRGLGRELSQEQYRDDDLDVGKYAKHVPYQVVDMRRGMTSNSEECKAWEERAIASEAMVDALIDSNSSLKQRVFELEEELAKKHGSSGAETLKSVLQIDEPPSSNPNLSASVDIAPQVTEEGDKAPKKQNKKKDKA